MLIMLVTQNRFMQDGVGWGGWVRAARIMRVEVSFHDIYYNEVFLTSIRQDNMLWWVASALAGQGPLSDLATWRGVRSAPRVCSVRGR